MPFALFLAGASQGHPLVQGNIVSNNGGFPDDDAGSMVDEQPFPDLGPGMDLDAGGQPGQGGNETGGDEPGSFIEEMGKPVGPDGVESRVTEHDFQGVLHRRIPLFDDSDVVAHGCKHSFLLPFGYKKRPPLPRGDLSRFHSDCSQTSAASHTGNGGCPEGPTYVQVFSSQRHSIF